MNKPIFVLAIAGILACMGCTREPSGGQAEDVGRAAAAALAVDLPARVQATNAASGNRTASHPTGNDRAAGKPRFPALLDAEQGVVDGAGLSVAKVAKVIRTEEFARFVQRLSSESGADPLAQDLTAAERERWTARLGNRAALSAFACGLTVCAGSIALGADTALYDAIAEEFLANGTQGGSLLDYRVDLGNGDFEQRFVMSVDPAVDGVTFEGRGPARP